MQCVPKDLSFGISFMQFAKIDLKNVKGVLLDLDNTLYAYEPCHDSALDKCRHIASTQFNISPSQFDEGYKTARKIIHERLHGQGASHSRLLYFHSQIEFITDKSNPEYALKMEETYWKAFLSEMKISNAALSFLKSLKERSIKICLVTDLTTQIQMQKWEKLSLNDLIDFMVTSEEAGVEKPHESIFKLALDKLKLKSHEVIMVGDNQEKDILGAEKLGIRSYLIDVRK